MTLFICLSVFLCHISNGLTTSSIEIEDEKMMSETFAKYGPPEDHIKYGLPGLELRELYDTNTSLTNTFVSEGSGTYVLRTRTITDYFSYNGRFENATLKTGDGGEIPIVKGQFGEHFRWKHRIFYLRTIGYVLDENGYRQFLIELRRIKINLLSLLGDPGAPSNPKITISSTVLGTLIGGNSLG